jgi:hypothetical protein
MHALMHLRRLDPLSHVDTPRRKPFLPSPQFPGPTFLPRISSLLLSKLTATLGIVVALFLRLNVSRFRVGVVLPLFVSEELNQFN